jgi:hypothetical protein
VEDLDEAIEELALAPDHPDSSAFDRLGVAELTGQQGMEAHVGLEDEVRVRERSLLDFERTIIDPCVYDDLAEAELVAGP